MGQGSGSLLFDYKSIVDCYPVTEYKSLILNDLKVLESIGVIFSHSSICYNVFNSNPNVFIHNHQWMYQSLYFTGILDVSQINSNEFYKNGNENNNEDNNVNLINSINDENNNIIYEIHPNLCGDCTWDIDIIACFQFRN